jgi:hypothetical protein
MVYTPVPVLGRNARLVKDSVAIGHGKGISLSADAESIKVYDMDARTPVITATGKQTFKWSMRRLYTSEAYMTLFKAGTSFTMEFMPEGTPLVTGHPKETWTGCVILHVGRDAGEDDGVLEDISGEATGVTETEAS